MTPINAASRPPSFGRRVAAKVTSLIAKFEAMSAAPNVQTRRKITPPRKRTLGSVVTPGSSSLSRRSTLRKSIGKKARIFVKLDWEKENANRRPAKVAPPPKRILKASRSITNPRGRRRVTLPIGNPASTTKKRRTLSGTFNCYSPSRYNADDEKSGITLDGPAFGPDTSSGSSTLRSTPAAPTPPVARILPSSFFSQLVAPDLPLKDTPRIRVFTDSEDSDLLIVEKRQRIDYKQFRLTSVDKQKSMWKRKITPPKISVKELISLFRPEEAAATRNVQVPAHRSPPPRPPKASVESSGGSGSIASSADTPLTLSPAISVTSSGSQRPPQDSIARGNGMQDLILSGSEVGTTGSTIGSSFASSLGRSLTSSQRSTVGRRALANVGVNVPSLCGTQPITQNALKRAVGSYSAPTRLDTPPLPSSKKYRKTPPPEGFFRVKRVRSERYSVAPTLYTLTSESEKSSGTESTSAGSTPSSGSRRNVLIKRTPENNGFTVMIGIPAMSIVTPTPVNAVQTIAIQNLVSRITELGHFKV